MTTTPSSADAIFRKHYDYYKNIGVETIKQQAGQVEQVMADYQGRVVFELLQNAFDKAEKNILVKVVGNTLYIANDGVKFSYQSDFDYCDGNSIRGDFQSLCSISTSTKSTVVNIGNKGVGFKSVFSVASEGFVNIYTDGHVLTPDGIKNERINFRIYDSFKSVNSLPIEFSADIRELVKKKIQQVQKERKDRGLPGYYYPVQICTEESTISQLFQEGFVTIIEIPFKEENKKTILSLFEEIKRIHFEFVQLKYDQKFIISFQVDDQPVSLKTVGDNKKKLFTVELDLQKIRPLAAAAGIEIEHPKVAFFILDQPQGLIYNYLPTKVPSPFPYIDFHADFYTKVDRTSINIDRLSAIGAYNNALMAACFELFFEVLNRSLQNQDQVILKIDFINKSEISGVIEEVVWDWLSLGKTSYSFTLIRNILRIWNNRETDYSYQTASKLLAGLAEKYFKASKPIDEHTKFFKVVLDLIDYYGRDDGQKYDWLEYFKRNVAKELRERKAKVIPSIGFSEETELFYKKSGDEIAVVPSFIEEVSLTNFEIKDAYLRKSLGVKDFNDYNEILKFFRQASLSGDVSYNRISEVQQKELLKCIARIFESKRESFTVSCYRYARTYSSRDRDFYSAINHANFSISTVFLKTKSAKFKPAQLCRKKELDLTFFEEIDLNGQMDSFLKFLGVSLNHNYAIADDRLYKVIGNGLDYIPAPLRRGEASERLTADSLLSNVHLISDDGECIHPALINDNNYSFLRNISGSSIDSELQVLLVKQYDSFPKEYLEKLYEKVQVPPKDLQRLYPKLFTAFHMNFKRYLITKGGKYFWCTSNDDFKIAKNREEYDLLRMHSLPLLCFYFGSEIPEQLQNRVLSLDKTGVTALGTRDITKEIASLLSERMIYILTAVDDSPFSEMNLKDDIGKMRHIQRLLQHLQVFECKVLLRKITCLDADLHFEVEADALMDDSNIIYFSINDNKKARAETLAKYFFNKASVAGDFELILFYKQLSDLEKEFSKEDLLFFKRLWISDYEEKQTSFVQDILDGFIESEEELDKYWYVYSSSSKSKILIKLDKEGKLALLENRIETVKANYDGLFDDFLYLASEAH